MTNASIAKFFFLLLLSVAATGCNEIAQVVTPTCSDEATLALVRKIMSENVADADHQLSPEELKKRLTLTMVHATKLEENIRKYTCEATLVASDGTAEHKMSLEYESQLDDAHDHLVQILNLTNSDAYVMKPILTAAAPASSPAPSAAITEDVPAKKSDAPNASLSQDQAFAFAAAKTCGDVIDKNLTKSDINGDGLDDLVAIFTTEIQCPEPGETPGNAGGRHVAVFLGAADGKFIFKAQDSLNVAAIDFNTIAPLEHIGVQFTAIQMGENDPSCCPTEREKGIIALSKSGISQTYRPETTN